MAPSPADAPQSPPRSGVFRGAGARVASALVMTPAALAAIYVGGAAFDAMIVAAAALMAFEWARLADRQQLRAVGLVLCGLVSGLALAFAFFRGQVSFAAWGALGVAAAAVPLLYGWARRSGVSQPGWLAAGAMALVGPCIALEWLRALPEIGRPLTFYLMLAVWTTDTGAYIFGRWIGGAKLAPRISPNKTWAGLLGGMGCAALVGGGLAFGLGGSPLLAAPLAAALAVVAQLGDLMESWFKRLVGAKDSGALIPGHGGVLDRVDGLLTAAPVLAVIVAVFGSVL